MQRSKRQWLKLWTCLVFGLLLLGSAGTIWAEDGNPDPGGAGSTTYCQQTLGKSNLGSATVGSDGSASYSYPMGPISLYYNSNKGWYVGGYSVITRSGRKGVPRYTVNDLFELDGEELVYIGGSNPREYKTKRESWRRVRYYSDGGSYWVVERPDGSKAYYGNFNDHRIEAVGGKNPGQIRAWVISNDISRGSYDWKKYYYEKDLSGGGFYLTRVEITKKDSTPSLNCLLTYTDHAYPKLDCRSGSFVLNNKILSEVKIFRGPLSEQNNNAYHLNTYVIESEYDVAGEWQVKSITPWGAGKIKALNATTFDYYDLQPKFRDADPSTPDVIDPVRWTISGDTESLIHNRNSDGTSNGFIDINGDGLIDRISLCRVMLNNGSGFDSVSAWPEINLTYYTSYLTNNTVTYYDMFDINADGLPDKVCFLADSPTITACLNSKEGISPSINYTVNSPDPEVNFIRFIHRSRDASYFEDLLAHWIQDYYDMVDINNDNLPDIVLKSGMAYINNGEGFNSAEECFWGGFRIRSLYYIYGDVNTAVDLIDMNGDGLPDYNRKMVNKNTLFTRYNTGYSDHSGINWNFTDTECFRDNTGSNNEYDYIDINNDGRPDRLQKQAGDLKVWMNMGYNKFGESITWKINDGSWLREGITEFTLSEFFDINGDGLVDRVYKASGREGDQLLIWFNDSGPSGKLKAIHNPLGGTTEYSYKPIDKTVNPDCKPAMWTVENITEKDGLGQALSTTYQYKSGVYDFKEREFRGFGEIKVTQPTGDYTISLYHTDNLYLIGKPLNIKTYNSSNSLMDETLYEWDQKETATGVQWAYLKKSESRLHDGDPSVSQKLITEYQYDSYGNPTVVKETGDSSRAGVQDLRITQNWYNNDTTNWNLVQLRQTSVVGYDQNRKLTLQRSTYHNYNNGNLVKTRNWLENPASPWPVNPDGTTNPANGGESNWVNPVEYFYDTYGNVRQVKDARENSSYTSYDSKYELFPIKQTNALGHVIWSFYDSISDSNEAAISAAITRGWLVKTLQAQTGINTIIGYDTFGRPVKKRERGYTDSWPSEETSYTDADVNLDGTIQTPACVTVRKRHDSSAATPEYLSYTYSDGSGRTIQVKDRQSEESYSTIDTYYEIDGCLNRTKVSVPYPTNNWAFSARDTAQLKTVTTDWLGCDGRYETVTGTDGSVVTTKETRGSKKITDARENSRLLMNNAFGLTESIYQNSASIENTYLTGSQELVKTIAGEIVTTTEYNSLGQEIKTVDPDLGTVTYTYDPNGNLIKQIDANLKTILFQYDALNRPTKVTYNGFNYDQFVYDEGDYATGKLSRSYAFRNNIKVEENQFKYSEYGDLISQTHWIDGKSKEIKYLLHDGLGRNTVTLYPNGDNVFYTYHPSGCGLDTIGVAGGGVTKPIVSGADYRISGEIEKLKLNDNNFNINYKYWEYDQVGAGLLKGIETTGTAANFKLGYSYDPNGNVETIDDYVTPGHSQSFHYDTLNQMDKAKGGTLYSEEIYQYDSTNGNMTKKAAKNLEYGLNYYGVGSKPHAVKDDGIYIYRYDAAGNLNERLFLGELPEQIFSIPRGVFHYGIYGQNNVTLNDRVQVRNYHGGWAPVGCYGTIQLGVAAYTGSVTSAWGTINLRGANIYGDAQTRGDITMQSGSVITGVSYPNTSVNPVLTPEVKVLKAIDFTGVPHDSIAINTGAPPVSLEPGKYWDYTLNNGTTLKLKSGVYYFNSLITNSGSTITLDESGGAIKIYVQTQLQLRAKLSHSAAEPYGAGYLLFGYLGSQDVFCGGNVGGTFAGSIVAPNAKIIGGQESTRTFQGMYIAKTVEFHQDSQIYCVPFFELVSQVNQYSYDEKNRLLEIKQNYFTNMTSVYGASGERIKKVESYTDSYYFFPEYEEEYVSASGAAKARNCYYFADGKRVAKKDANGFYYYFINDHLGSTSQVVNDSGAAVKTLKYRPYGETVLESGTLAEDYKFNGKELDSSGLYYYGARYYDSSIGRFITADAVIPGNGFDLLGLNRYSYCLNNPIKYVDPDGNNPRLFLTLAATVIAKYGWKATKLGWQAVKTAPAKKIIGYGLNGAGITLATGLYCGNWQHQMEDGTNFFLALGYAIPDTFNIPKYSEWTTKEWARLAFDTGVGMPFGMLTGAFQVYSKGFVGALKWGKLGYMGINATGNVGFATALQVGRGVALDREMKLDWMSFGTNVLLQFTGAAITAKSDKNIYRNIASTAKKAGRQGIYTVSDVLFGEDTATPSSPGLGLKFQSNFDWYPDWMNDIKSTLMEHSGFYQAETDHTYVDY